MLRDRFIPLNSLPTRKAEFIVPMECLRVSRLDDGPEWMFEIKLDGYRASAVKSGHISLYSRRKKSCETVGSNITDKCPFVNLPDEHPSRCGESLTAEKMKQCVWVRPKLIAVVEFLEWTDADRLRHSHFVGLREDKDAREVVKEHAEDR